MRKLTDVIDKIIAVVPEGNDHLIERLSAVRASSSLASPEMQPEWWDKLYEVLVSEIGEINEGWKEQVRAIFSGGD